MENPAPQPALDTVQDIDSLIEAEMQRRVFALRVATDEEVQIALRWLGKTSVNHFIIENLAAANAPKRQGEIERAYDDEGRWRNLFSEINPTSRKAIKDRTRLSVHLDNCQPHNRYNVNDRLWTLASQDRPIEVVDTVSSVVQGWHFAAEEMTKSPNLDEECRTTIKAFVREYAALPLHTLGEDCDTKIAAANEKLGEKDVQIHAHRGYGIIGPVRAGFKRYFVDSPEMRQRLAVKLAE